MNNERNGKASPPDEIEGPGGETGARIEGEVSLSVNIESALGRMVIDGEDLGGPAPTSRHFMAQEATPPKPRKKQPAAKVNVAEAVVGIVEGRPDKIPFPMPNWLFADALEEMAEVYGIPVGLIAAEALGLASIAIGGCVEIEGAAKGRTTRTGTNIYVITIAQTGTGKSLAHGRLSLPLLQFQNNLEPIPVVDGKEGEKAKPIFMMRAPTPEAFLLQFGGKGRPKIPFVALVSADARAVVSNFNGRYNSGGRGDFSSLLACYSREPVGSERVGEGSRVYVPKPCAAISWCLQPDKGNELASSECGQSGFLARCLIARFTDLPRTWSENEERDLEHISDWDAVIGSALQVFHNLKPDEPLVINADVCRPIFRAYHNEVVASKRLPEDIDCRLAENAIRIAGILHCLKYLSQAGEYPLEEEVVKEAIGIVRWFEGFALESAALKEADITGRILSVLARPGFREGATLREIQRAVPFGTGGEARAELEPLVEAGRLVSWEGRGKNGRRVSLYGLPINKRVDVPTGEAAKEAA